MGPQMLAKKYANFIEWAYYNFGHMLPIFMGGPINLLNCAANDFEGAQYILWECFPMPMNGPSKFWTGPSEAYIWAH